MANFNDIFIKCEELLENVSMETKVSIEKATNDLISVIYSAINDPEVEKRCFCFKEKNEYRYTISSTDKTYGEHLRWSSIIRKSMKNMNLKTSSYKDFKISRDDYYNDFEIRFNEFQIIKFNTDRNNNIITVTIIKLLED